MISHSFRPLFSGNRGLEEICCKRLCKRKAGFGPSGLPSVCCFLAKACREIASSGLRASLQKAFAGNKGGREGPLRPSQAPFSAQGPARQNQGGSNFGEHEVSQWDRGVLGGSEAGGLFHHCPPGLPHPEVPRALNSPPIRLANMWAKAGSFHVHFT